MGSSQKVSVTDSDDSQGKRVKFSASVNFSSDHTPLICTSEFRMLWYSPMSLARIGTENRRDFREGLRRVKRLSSNKSCTRGLELLSEDDDRVKNMKKIRDETLEMHMKLKVERKEDPEKLAAAYSKLVKLAKKQALERADNDEAEMKKICAKELQELAKEKKPPKRKSRWGSKTKKKSSGGKKIAQVQQTSEASKSLKNKKEILSRKEQDPSNERTTDEEEMSKTEDEVESTKSSERKRSTNPFKLKKLIFFRSMKNQKRPSN